MSVYTKTANDVFSPVNADGKARSVLNQDAQRWGEEVQASIVGASLGMIRATSIAGLGSGTRVGQPGQVTQDPDSGEYYWSGSAWIRTGDIIDPPALQARIDDARTDLQAGIDDVQNEVSNHSALENLIYNGNLFDNARGVRLYSPDIGKFASYSARIGMPSNVDMERFDCRYGIAIPASLGGSGNLIVQDVLLQGGFVLFSMLVKSSNSGWSFGNSNGLQCYVRYSDGTSAQISTGSGTLQFEIVGSIRRYYGTIALDPSKTAVRIDMGLNDAGARTADIFISGFWASWANAAPSIDQTAYPNWRGCTARGDISPTVDDHSYRLRRAQFTALYDAISDPLQSVVLALLGDSLTWGLSATGNGTSTPRGHALTDPRDVLTSLSWANKLGAWLGFRVCSGQGLSNPSPGVREYRQSQLIDVAMNPKVKMISSIGLEIGKTTNAATGGKLRKYVSVFQNYELTFDFFGDQMTLWFSKLNTDAGASFDVYLDDVLIGDDISHYASPAAFSGSYVINTTLGHHTVRVRNNSATQNLRVEAIEHNRLCRVINNGIIGTNSTEWLPTGNLLSGGLPASATHAILMIGTNDRSDSSNAPTDAVKITDNLSTIADWIAANRAATAFCLMTPPKAIGPSEEGGGTVPDYFFTAAEAAQAATIAAARKKLPCIDVYAHTNMLDCDGIVYLESTGLHFNDTGSSEVYRLIAKHLS
ncbi:hypothetical protein [Rhizobium sp.]|uniref:hypothetical protein n=1 Tax=Rhizobium sp. TaxID=391 RepID=UPI0034C66FC8